MLVVTLNSLGYEEIIGPLLGNVGGLIRSLPALEKVSRREKMRHGYAGGANRWPAPEGRLRLQECMSKVVKRKTCVGCTSV